MECDRLVFGSTLVQYFHALISWDSYAYSVKLEVCDLLFFQFYNELQLRDWTNLRSNFELCTFIFAETVIMYVTFEVW